MNIETIKLLKERAKEMLNDNYERKIDAEEIYTIICEWEQEKENSVKIILNMLEDLDKRRDIQKDIDPITGYWSKRAMLKKILKEFGFDYKKYKRELLGDTNE